MNNNYHSLLGNNLNPNQIKGTPVNRNHVEMMDPQLMKQLYEEHLAKEAAKMNQMNRSEQINQNNPNNSNNSNNPNEDIVLSDIKSQSAKETKPSKEEINQKMKQLLKKKQNKQKLQKKTVQKKKVVPEPVSKKPNNKIKEYVVMPVILVILFVILVHPSTSKMMEKYIPSLESTKGIIVRGVILAILYIVILTVMKMLG